MIQRSQDLVAHEQNRWIGRVAEALYNVEARGSRVTAMGWRLKLYRIIQKAW